jgi:cell division septation protein DedD
VQAQDIAAARGVYTLQLFSLEERRKAEEATKGWKIRGYDARYHEVQIRGKIWYRVTCGRFGTKGEAEEYARRFAAATGIKGLVAKIE